MTALENQVEQLPPADRLRLVEHILTTLDKPDAEIDAAWAKESERRLEAYRKGETTARDAADVLAKHLS
jgi:putative addiction module component (TIGR02574 family)